MPREDSTPAHLTPGETAQLLRVSPRTLANWRSLGEGPAWRKHGGRVVYLRASVMGFGTEIGAEARRGKPHVTITLRPYPRDRTRFQVDIMLPHPATNEIIRRRITAPQGMDEAAAKAWGERQVKDILRELFRSSAKIETDEAPKIEPKPSRGGPTMADLWVKYEAEILNDPEQATPRTRITYQKIWNRVRGLAGKVRVAEWSREHTAKVASKFRNCGARYANQVMIVLGNLFKVALADKHIGEVPRLERRKAKKALKPKAHNASDLDRLLQAARGIAERNKEGLEALLLLGLDAGLRPGEIAGLRWGDIDWNANLLMVQNQRPQKMGKDEEYLPKYQEVGSIPMTTRLRVALEMHQLHGLTSRTFVLISAKTKEPLITDTVSDRIERIHMRAGMPRAFRAHFLRHCAASRVAHHPKGSVSAANGLLRHKHLTTTELYLNDIRGTDQGRRAVAILDTLAEEETGNDLATGGNTRQNERLDLN